VQRFVFVGEGEKVLLSAMTLSSPFGVPSCKTAEMQHCCMGPDAMVMMNGIKDRASVKRAKGDVRVE